ncbi:MAG TPA: hypothetical protein VMS38_20395 [Pseudorhodoferax sp.]|nr:hypothetical protein [Pseudorhodoferax sp.]
MALLMEETLGDGRTLGYHRIAECVFTMSVPLVRFTLESFEDAAARLDPTVVPYRREFDFPYLADPPGDPREDAYRALMARDEWSAAVGDDDNADITPGPHEARPAGQSEWYSDAECWADESVNAVAEDKLRALITRFKSDEYEDIWSGGLYWYADADARHRLIMACAVVARAPDPSAVTRSWWGEDWTGPHTVTGTQLLQLQADMDQRSQEASAHLEAKRQEIIDAMELTPASSAIAALNAIEWEFDAPFWGFPE